MNYFRVDAYGTSAARTYTFERASGSGHITARIDPLNRRTEYTHNSAGKVTQVTQLAGTADAVTTQYTYTADYQQLQTVTDPLGHTTTYS